MKVLLFKEMQNALKVSGIGRAYRQQKEALKINGVEVTMDPNDDYDLVHFNTVFRQSHRFLKKMKKAGIPVVVHAHSTEEDFLNSFNFANLVKGWFYKRLKNMYSKADLLITPTNYSKSLLESYGYIDAPIIPLSNGINLSEYVYKEKNVQEFKDFFDIKENDKVVIGVGLLFERKGLHDFIEVARSMPDVKFIWFGKLNKLVQTRKIRKAIKRKPDNVIMPGYIAGSIIKGAFSGADALLFPSYEETEGIVILEAMASHLPVVLRKHDVYADYENEKEVLKGENNAEFIELLERVFNNDMSKMTDAAYKKMEEKDLVLIGKELKNIYSDLLKDFKKETKLVK